MPLLPFHSFTSLFLAASQAVIENVRDHCESLDFLDLDSTVSNVLTLESQEDQKELSHHAAGEVTWRYNQLVLDSTRWTGGWKTAPLSSQPWHLQGTGGLTAGKQISSVTIHQGVLLSVTAVSALVNPYTMEGWSRCAFFFILP